METKSCTSRTYILIPSYEPDESLVTLVKRLKDEGFAVILVNDGSSEKYDYIFNQVKDDVNYLVQKPNKGKGQTLRYGFSFANLHQENFDFVITCDGDGQHAVEDILKVNDRLIKTKRPVFGVRKFDKNTPKRSRNGNFMSRLCRTLITKDYIADDQCGLRGFPLSYMNELLTIKGDHYEYEMNVICTFQLKRFRYEEVQIQTIYLDNNASSHFSPALDTFRIQRVIWTYDLLPLVCFLTCWILFTTLDTLLIEYIPTCVTFTFMMAFNLCMYFGLISLFYPTRQVGRRAMVEGIFYSIKFIFAAGFFVLFFYVLNLWASLSYFIATFLITFINFLLAILIHKIKNKR